MNRTLNDDQLRLVCENLEWAEQLAWCFGCSILGDKYEKSITMDDLRQEAVCGLMEAAMRFSPTLALPGEGKDNCEMSGAAAFQTYAYIWIRKYVLRAIRKYGTPLTVPYNFEGGVELLHLDAEMDDVAGGYADGSDDNSPTDRLLYDVAMAEAAEQHEQERQEERETLAKRMLEGLSDRERKTLECLFGLYGMEMSGPETAKELGVTLRHVNMLKERALRKLEMMKLPTAC